MTKQALEKSYRDLSAGRLSRQEAFEKVMALGIPAKLPTPCWSPCRPGAELDAGAVASAWSQHRLLALGLPSSSVEALRAHWPQARVEVLPSVEGDVGETYTAAALACFAHVQALLRSAPEGAVLVQVVVGEGASASVHAGLSGLLKTVSLENPQVRGQVLLGASVDGCVVQVERRWRTRARRWCGLRARVWKRSVGKKCRPWCWRRRRRRCSRNTACT